MKLAIILLFGLNITFLSCGEKDKDCPDYNHNSFTFNNTSVARVNYTIYWNYPDTAIGEFNPVNSGYLNGNTSQSRGAGPNSCWESILKDNKKEWIYIFSQDSLETLDWNIIRNTNRGLLERRLIDLNYLQNNDFTITYP